MLLQQRQKRCARAHRRDEVSEISQREIRIGQTAYLVEQNWRERFQQLGASRARRRVRTAARKNFQVDGAFLGLRKAERREAALGDRAIRDRSPRRASDIGDFGQALLLAAREGFAKLIGCQIAMPTQRRAQPRQRPVALAHPEPEQQLAHAGIVARERMSLQAGNDLKLVFDVAQKQVCLFQFAGAFGGQVAKIREAVQRLDSFLAANAWITAAINQGERLHDEFELANSAISEFDVALDQVRRTKFRLDLMLHRAQLAERVEVEIAAIDETVELIEQSTSELNRTGDRPRAKQRRTLPGLSVVLVEVQRAVERNRERGIAPARAQPHVDPKASGGEKLGDDLADPSRRDTARARRRRIENVDQIDVRAEVEFARPELAHRENAKFSRLGGALSDERTAQHRKPPGCIRRRGATSAASCV